MNTIRYTTTAAALGALALVTLPASAAVTITQQSAPAPTYSTLLTFDEPGAPTGIVADNYWQPGYGITSMTDGVNGPAVGIDDLSAFYPWVNTGNVVNGNFGIYITFDQAVTAMSFQAWDPSGSPSPFGGGMNIYLTDINDNIIEALSFTGAWGGIGDEWFDITTSGGTTFQKVVIFNNSFDPYTFIDNVSWNNVPAPGSFALIAVAGLVGRKRRRA